MHHKAPPILIIMPMGHDLTHIEIEKDDILSHIYFVCSIAQEGRMYGGISGKSDYIGGIFDRWINTIPESVIFNKHLLPKIFGDREAEVISDYFRYVPQKAGIAPDVIGVKIDGSKIVKFTEYDNKWKMIEGAPNIEVKSFKNNQYMVSLRDQGYDDYLVMVETDLSSDYLLPFFEDSVLSDEIYSNLIMSEDLFIINNDEGHLKQTKKIHRDVNNLGSLNLITICRPMTFKIFSNLCGAGESPVYIKEIREGKKNFERLLENSKPFSEYVEINEVTGLYKWKMQSLDPPPKENRCMLDISIENIDNIKYISNSKSSITIYINHSATINNQLLEQGGYIIKIQDLDRSASKQNEYFMHKSIINHVPTEEDRMLEHMRTFIHHHLQTT